MPEKKLVAFHATFMHGSGAQVLKSVNTERAMYSNHAGEHPSLSEQFLLVFPESEHDYHLWINTQQHLFLGSSVSEKHLAVLKILTGSSHRQS